MGLKASSKFHLEFMQILQTLMTTKVSSKFHSNFIKVSWSWKFPNSIQISSKFQSCMTMIIPSTFHFTFIRISVNVHGHGNFTQISSKFNEKLSASLKPANDTWWNLDGICWWAFQYKLLLVMANISCEWNLAEAWMKHCSPVNFADLKKFGWLGDEALKKSKTS